MKVDRLYKHKKGRDLAIKPLVIKFKNNEFSISCEYINLAYNIPFDIVDDITIKEEDMKNWELYENMG